jgi:putative ABC transport system permease protein
MTARRASLLQRLAVRVYRTVLGLYPAGFRDGYGREMVEVFRRISLDRRARGAGSVLRFWLRAFSEVPGSALRLRREQAASRNHSLIAPAIQVVKPRRQTMRSILHDARFAARTLRRTPAITAVALLTLALGIGANTAIFSVINGVLFHPMSSPEAERLMMVLPSRPDGDQTGVSYPEFRDWEGEARSFEAMSLARPQSVGVTGGGREPERIRGMFVTAGFFDALRERPVLGRAILAGEDAPGAPRTAVLSDGFWRRRWGADPDAIGEQVVLNNHPHTIVGVMGPEFQFPFDTTEAWISVQTNPGELGQDRADRNFWAFGRLRDGVSREEAAEEMRVIADRLAAEYPETNRDLSATVEPLAEAFSGGGTRRMFWVMLGAVAMVLLIGTANVANLQLARATGRGREMAIRSALGCGRGRLVRQLLTENLLLALAGGVLGVAVAVLGIQLLLAYGPSWIGDLYRVSIDLGVLAFVAAVTLLTSVLFGLAPALRGSRVEPTAGLRQAGRSVSEGRTANRLRAALVVSQTGLAVMLLIAAGLLIQSFAHLGRVEVGFDRDDLLTVQFRLPENKYESDESVVAFFDRMLERVAAVPGVEGAATAYGMPFTADEGSFALLADGVDPGPEQAVPEAYGHVVSLDYFEVMGIPLLAGRGFEPGDRAGGAPVAVLSRSVAETLWPGEDPVGRTVGVRGVPETFTVVGIAGDIRSRGLDADWTRYAYVPYTQSPSRFATLAVRVPVAPSGYATAVREAIWSLDPDQPLWEVMTQNERIGFWVDSNRFTTGVLTVFAAVALLLAASGLAGVIAYMVARRTHEFGIRLALGAGRGKILQLVLRTGGLMLAGGVVLGLAGAIAVSRVLSSLLFGIDALDAATFAAAPAVLAAVGLAATYLPARRAAGVDPVIALRHD